MAERTTERTLLQQEVATGMQGVADHATAHERLLDEPSTGMRPLSSAEALLHLFKGNIGPGILALPLHFSRTGVVSGALVMAAIGLQGVYGMVMLVITQQHVARRLAPQQQPLSEPLTLGKIAGAALGPRGECAIEAFVAANQLGVCSVYIALLGQTVAKLTALSQRVAALIAFAPCAALALIPRLTALWPLSLFGSAVMLTALVASVAAAAQTFSAAPLAPRPPPSAAALFALTSDDVD